LIWISSESHLRSCEHVRNFDFHQTISVLVGNRYFSKPTLCSNLVK